MDTAVKLDEFEEAVYEQLTKSPRWAGNIVATSGVRGLVEKGIAVYDRTAQDPQPGYGVRFMITPGAYRLVSTIN